LREATEKKKGFFSLLHGEKKREKGGRMDFHRMAMIT